MHLNPSEIGSICFHGTFLLYYIILTALIYIYIYIYIYAWHFPESKKKKKTEL